MFLPNFTCKCSGHLGEHVKDQRLWVELSLYLFEPFQGNGHLLPTRKKCQTKTESTEQSHTVRRVACTRETKPVVLAVTQSWTKAHRRSDWPFPLVMAAWAFRRVLAALKQRWYCFGWFQSPCMLSTRRVRDVFKGKLTCYYHYLNWGTVLLSRNLKKTNQGAWGIWLSTHWQCTTHARILGKNSPRKQTDVHSVHYADVLRNASLLQHLLLAPVTFKCTS